MLGIGNKIEQDHPAGERLPLKVFADRDEVYKAKAEIEQLFAIRKNLLLRRNFRDAVKVGIKIFEKKIEIRDKYGVLIE